MPTKATTFYKATVQYCLGEERRKGEGFRYNRPFFFTVHGDFPHDVSFSQIHNKHTNLKKSWPRPCTFQLEKTAVKTDPNIRTHRNLLALILNELAVGDFLIFFVRFRWLRSCSYVLSFPRNFLESFGVFECGSISQTSRMAAQCLHWK